MCPVGATAGSTVSFEVNKKILAVVVPAGVGPGQAFVVQVGS